MFFFSFNKIILSYHSFGAWAKQDRPSLLALAEYSLGYGASICSSCNVDRIFVGSPKCLKPGHGRGTCKYTCYSKSHTLHYEVARRCFKLKCIQFMEELLILQMELNIGQQTLPKSKPLHTT